MSLLGIYGPGGICHTTDICEYTHAYTSGMRSREGMGEAKLVSAPF